MTLIKPPLTAKSLTYDNLPDQLKSEYRSQTTPFAFDTPVFVATLACQDENKIYIKATLGGWHLWEFMIDPMKPEKGKRWVNTAANYYP